MRARNIKPDFFKNDELAELPFSTRLLFIGLWCYADRDGFFEARLKKIKAEIFPYEEQSDLSPWRQALLTLARSGFIQIYHPTESTTYACGEPVLNPIIKIVNFTKHQRPHHNEKPSIYKDIIRTCNLGNNHLPPRREALRPERGMMNDERGMMNEGSRNLRQKKIFENSATEPKAKNCGGSKNAAERSPVKSSKENFSKSKSRACQVYREIFHLWPNPTQESEIDKHISASESDAQRWMDVCRAWAMRGYRPTGVEGMLDWWRNGIPAKRINSRHEKNQAAIDKALAQCGEEQLNGWNKNDNLGTEVPQLGTPG